MMECMSRDGSELTVIETRRCETHPKLSNSVLRDEIFGHPAVHPFAQPKALNGLLCADVP